MVLARSNHDSARGGLLLSQRLHGVVQEIQDHLLKLHAIAGHGDRIVGELRAQKHTIALELSTRQCNDFACRLVKIDQLAGHILLAEERTQSCDHVSRAVSIANCAPRGFTRAVDVWRIRVQHAHTRTRVCDNA